jgi:hypothetical protein
MRQGSGGDDRQDDEGCAGTTSITKNTDAGITRSAVVPSNKIVDALLDFIK